MGIKNLASKFRSLYTDFTAATSSGVGRTAYILLR